LKPAKILIETAAWNEGEKVIRVAERVLAFIQNRAARDPLQYEFLLIDDGSTDKVTEKMPGSKGVHIIRHENNLGAGASERTAYRFAQKQGFDIVVPIAGNGKDDPEEIPRLIEPILERGFDFVQGSRYLSSKSLGDMPLHRYYATRYVHPLLFSLFTGARFTDTTNGFRAIRVSILNDKRINLDQDWLNRYELEPYLFFKAVKLGYRVLEVPVRKVYPDRGRGYTKMAPFIGWWSIMKPLFYLGLGIKD